MSAFVIKSGKFQGKRLRLSEPELVVGRDASCRIRLSSEEVSRFHCAIRQTDDGWTVRDLGSSNGTYINDAAIDNERVLMHGDQLSVGPMTLEFVDSSKPASKKGHTPGPTISEDDIAGLLSDADVPVSTGDTTIINVAQLKPPAEAEPKSAATEDSAEPEKPRPALLKKPVRQFGSIAEEAADIIRRHWESVEQDEAG